MKCYGVCVDPLNFIAKYYQQRILTSGPSETLSQLDQSEIRDRVSPEKLDRNESISVRCYEGGLCRSPYHCCRRSAPELHHRWTYVYSTLLEVNNARSNRRVSDQCARRESHKATSSPASRSFRARRMSAIVIPDRSHIPRKIPYCPCRTSGISNSTILPLSSTQILS